MSDEQNKSRNRAPMNGSVMSDIEKIGKSAYSHSKAEQDQRIRSQVAQTQLDALAEIPDDLISRSRALSRVATNAPNTIASAEQRIQSSVANRLERSNLQAVRAIGKQYSATSINSMARRMYEDPYSQIQALRIGTSSYEDLSQRREALNSQIQDLGASSAYAAKALFGEQGRRGNNYRTIEGNALQTNSIVSELASIDLALRNKKQLGLDPLSRFEKLNATGRSAEDLLTARGIGGELSRGGVDIKGAGGETVNIASGDINKALVREAENLKKALSDLATTTETSKEKLDEMRAKAEQSAENFEKLNKAAADGGGGRNNTISYLNAAAGGFNAIGGAANQIMVNQRMQQVGNISGFAGLAGLQYDMYSKARGGDIASQLALSQFSKADDFGMEMKRATNIVQGAQIAGAAAQTAAGGLQIASTLNPAENIIGTSAAQANRQQGVLNTIQGGASLAVISSDAARGVSAQSNRLAGIQAQMQARMAINTVGARQAQGLRDMYTGLDVVGQNMGSRASSFIDQSGSVSNLQRMEDARMSPEQYIQMAQIGAQNMGSTFSNNQIFASRNLEARGFGSMQDNMTRMSQLAAAGANNPKEGMESVLSAAMSKGLDSSKAISMMVENTAAMVSVSSGAAVGIDTTGAASSLLAAGMNPNMANKEFALQQSMSAQQITNRDTTNRDVSFIGMANTAGLQKALSKAGVSIGGDQAIALQGIDLATLKSLEGDPKKAQAFFQDKGINISEKNSDIALKAITREKQLQVLRPATISQGLNAGTVLDKMTAGTLTEEERRSVAVGATLHGRTGLAELERQVKGIPAPNTLPGVGKDLTEGKGPDDLKKQMDTLRTSGFQQLTQAAASASEQLGGFSKAIKTFTDLQQQFEKGGRGNEVEYAGAAGRMAKDFDAVAVKFDGAGTKMEQAADQMMKAAGLLSNRNPIMPIFDIKDEKKGPSRANQ